MHYEKWNIVMKKCGIVILLLTSCFIISRCFNKGLSSSKERVIMIKDDLKNTKKINIKAVNSAEVIKFINNENEVNEIIDIIISSKNIEDDENIVYISSSYVLEMIDEKGNIFETIDLFLPYNAPKFIKLNQLNEFYYVDVDKILAIFKEN